MNATQSVVNTKLKNKISDFVVGIGEGTGKVSNKFLLDMVYGLVRGGDIKLSKIALAREVLLYNPTCNKLLLSRVLHVARSLLYYQSKILEFSHN